MDKTTVLEIRVHWEFLNPNSQNPHKKNPLVFVFVILLDCSLLIEPDELSFTTFEEFLVPSRKLLFQMQQSRVLCLDLILVFGLWNLSSQVVFANFLGSIVDVSCKGDFRPLYFNL